MGAIILSEISQSLKDRYFFHDLQYPKYGVQHSVNAVSNNDIFKVDCYL